MKNDFAYRLRSERKRLNLKQNEFAEKINIPSNTYNGYETGKRKPNIDVVNMLADALGVSVDYLLGRSDSRTLNNECGVSENAAIEKIINGCKKILDEECDAKKIDKLSESDIQNIINGLEFIFKCSLKKDE